MSQGSITLQEAFEKAVGLEQEGRLEDAERLLERILATVPDQPDALHQLGIVAARRKNFVEAARLIERAIAGRKDSGLHYRNICEIYRRLGRLEEAIAAGKRAIELNPKDPHSLVNLAIIYYASCEFEKAADCCEQAIVLAPKLPGAHFELAEALLVRGEFARGWEEYEWRFQIAGANQPMPKTDKPLWDGKPVDGTLLLVADQGFGDVIQFSRFLPWVRSICPDLVIASAREMHAILGQIVPGVTIADRWEAIPPYAAYSSLSGLPRVYGIRGDNIPGAPYLRAEPKRAAKWRSRLDALTPPNFRRIGIVWAGRPTHNNDFNRSIALAQLAPLAGLERTVLVSLQKGPAQTQIGAYFGRAPLLNLGPELRDYEDTMAVLDGLDLMVTVDTSAAHLAGAMGKTVLVMLPYAPDWRWLAGRSDTPWYPSLQLLRQAVSGQWAPVVAVVASQLQTPAKAPAEAVPA